LIQNTKGIISEIIRMDSKRNNLKYSSSDDELAALKRQMKANKVQAQKERKRVNRLSKKVTRAALRESMNPSLHDDDDYVPLMRIMPRLQSRVLVCQWGKKEKRHRHNLTIRRANTASGWEVETASFKNFRSVRFDKKDKRFPNGVWKVKCRLYETTLFQSSMGNGAMYQMRQLEKEASEVLESETKEVLRLCKEVNKVSEVLNVDPMGVDVDEDELERFMAGVEEEVQDDFEKSLVNVPSGLPGLPRLDNSGDVW